MKKWEISVLAGLVLCLILSQFSVFAESCAAVRTDTLRLHILANSDSEADQALKLAVRDALLTQYGAVFSGASSQAEAVSLARKNADAMRASAQEVVRKAGSPYAVKVEITNCYFPTKQYESFLLPAGFYDAVRVQIGAAAGHNWFCVMYPALCLPTAGENASLEVYTPREQSVVRSGYTVKFAALELLEKLRS